MEQKNTLGNFLMHLCSSYGGNDVFVFSHIDI